MFASHTQVADNEIVGVWSTGFLFAASDPGGGAGWATGTGYCSTAPTRGLLDEIAILGGVSGLVCV